MTENPYKLAGGNPAGSLAQSITNLGNLFADRAERKAKFSEKMMDSESRIRENAEASKQDRKTLKAQGKIANKGYKSQVKANVKAAERLTGTEKGKGVTQPGTKFSMTPTSLDATTKKATRARAAAKPAAKPAAKTPAPKNNAMVKGTNVPKAPVKGVPKAKAATPKPTARKAK
jgi:hypothetical protein